MRGPLGPLKGVLLSPEGVVKPPVVLILPGSGAVDRDGNNGAGIRAATYRLLAEALAERGVAAARVDKRGLYSSRAAIADPNAVTIDAYAADAQGWARVLKARTGAPCVWLVGHSEGALVALKAAQTPKDICGVVSLAGPGRNMGDVLRDQIKSAPGGFLLVPPAGIAIETLKAGKTFSPLLLPLPLQFMFRSDVQGFLINELTYDPPDLVKRYAGPLLIMQGTNDIAIGLEDAEGLAGARPGLKFLKLEGVNHVLKVSPAARTANIASYADPSLPLAPGVAEAIAAFVKTAPAAP